MTWSRAFLPEARSGCVRWRLPAQTLCEKLCESRGGGPGSRCRGRACACGMVRATLAYRRTHAQFHQEAKKLGQSSAKSGWSCRNTSEEKQTSNRIDYIEVGREEKFSNYLYSVNLGFQDTHSPESNGFICLMRVAIAGVSLDLALGSAVVGSSVSIGAKLSPSKPMPSKSPPAEDSTDTASESNTEHDANKSRELLTCLF